MAGRRKPKDLSVNFHKIVNRGLQIVPGTMAVVDQAVNLQGVLPETEEGLKIRAVPSFQISTFAILINVQKPVQCLQVVGFAL